MSTPTPAPSVEQGIDAFLTNTRQTISHRLETCEKDIRESPAKSVLAAAAVGYCLHRLPVRAILAAHVRLAAALMPPALALFGAAKLYDFLQTRAAAPSK